MDLATGAVVRKIGEGQLNFPSDVALDGKDNLFVALRGDMRIMVFHACTGTLITSFKTPSQIFPESLFVDTKEGCVVVGGEFLSVWRLEL